MYDWVSSSLRLRSCVAGTRARFDDLTCCTSSALRPSSRRTIPKVNERSALQSLTVSGNQLLSRPNRRPGVEVTLELSGDVAHEFSLGSAAGRFLAAIVCTYDDPA